MPECPGKILARGKVDGGLAAHGRIDHGEQAGRHLDKAAPAHIARGGKAGDVPGDAAPERDDDIGARELGDGHELEDLLEGVQALSCLTGLERVGEDLVAGILEARSDGLFVKRTHIGVGDDDGALAAGGRARDGADLFQEKGTDMHLVGARRVDIENITWHMCHWPFCASSSSLRLMRSPSAKSASSASPSRALSAVLYAVKESTSVSIS